MADDVRNDIVGSDAPVAGSPAQTPAGAAPAGVPVPAGETIPDVGLVGLPRQSQARPAAPLDLSPSGDMQADIQKILGNIKLPERRSAEKPTAEKTIEVAPIEQHLENPVPPTPAVERPIVTPVHTLRDDIQHVVREEKMSLVRAATLEEDRKLREKEAEESPVVAQRVRKTRGTLFAAGLFMILGLAAIGGVMLVMQQQAMPPMIDNTTIVFAEQQLTLPLDGSSPASLKQRLADFRRGQAGSLGSLVRIVPTVATTGPDGLPAQYPATTREFFAAFGFLVPDELLRGLRDEFFFGVHVADENAPVIVIPVAAYDNAFAGMLSWETRMNADLSPLFTPLAPYYTDQDGIPHERAFTDLVMQNYDARILMDDAAQIQLYYSFPSPRVLIIAENQYTLAEVVARLRAQRRL